MSMTETYYVVPCPVNSGLFWNSKKKDWGPLSEATHITEPMMLQTAEQTKKAGTPHLFIRLDIAQNAEAGRRKKN